MVFNHAFYHVASKPLVEDVCMHLEYVYGHATSAPIIFKSVRHDLLLKLSYSKPVILGQKQSAEDGI